MRVGVLYFGVLKELMHAEGDLVELPAEATVATLVEAVRGRGDWDAKVWGSIAVAVNREYATAETVLSDGDEVALLPPVSGGVGDAG